MTFKSESNIFTTEFSKSNTAALFIQFPAYFTNPELWYEPARMTGIKNNKFNIKWQKGSGAVEMVSLIREIKLTTRAIIYSQWKTQ